MFDVVRSASRVCSYAAVLTTALALPACGAGPNGRSGQAVRVPQDPTPLTKCKVAASQDNPLVTEWPASEKARLESLLSAQAVAVEYSGCELRIVGRCALAGRYAWQKTTLATDTVEIADEDDLYAKLPLGALALEGELSRSGRLAVRTTVGGHRRLEAMPAVPSDEQCGSVTHVVSAVSVGAFRLMSGGSVSSSAAAGALGVGAGVSSKNRELVLREAGDPERCREATDESPPGECASPIQLFLTPVNRATPSAAAYTDASEQRARQRGFLVALPGPEDSLERWSLHDADDQKLCELPCERWIAPRSGYYLNRTKTRDYGAHRIDVPNELSHEPGSRLTAEYTPGRGDPFWSKLLFYGLGIPAAIGGVATVVIGATSDESDKRAFWFSASALYFGIAAGSAWWFVYSRPDEFTTYEEQPAPRSQPRSRVIGIAPPALVVGSF